MSIPITKFSAAIARRENEGAERQRRIDELEEQSHQYAAAVVNFLRANAASAFTAEEIARAIGALDWYEAERLHYENPSAVYSSFFPSGGLAQKPPLAQKVGVLHKKLAHPLLKSQS